MTKKPNYAHAKLLKFIIKIQKFSFTSVKFFVILNTVSKPNVSNVETRRKLFPL
jgi:hypothetical protein